MAYVQIKNTETNLVEVKDVGEILQHFHQQNDTNAETVKNLPVHEMLHSVRVSSEEGRVLECTYNVKFENRLLRIRRGVLSNRLPRPLYNLLGVTDETEGLYLNEFEGLRFKAKIRGSQSRVNTEEVTYPFRGRKVLPNVYHDGKRVCFGTTRFNERNALATPIEDVGRMLQSFFASTFNTDLSDTGVSDRVRTKQNILDFLAENGHTRIHETVNQIEPQAFLNVYTIWAIASYTKESLSKFERLLV